MNASASFNLVRNAAVEVNPIFNDRGHVQAQITINDQYAHLFDVSSRVSKVLAHSNSTESLNVATKQLQDRMTGGSFFIVNDELIDFRDSSYAGFTHTDSAIDNLMQHIGISANDNKIRAGLKLNTINGNYMLSNIMDTDGFEVPGYQSGGVFKSNILFTWNPYTSFIRGAFQLVRIICTNGLVGVTDLINSRIPIINRWDEHLEIAKLQMQNSVKTIVCDRIAEMGNERASVSTLQLISSHATKRRDESTNTIDKDRLTRIHDIVDPLIHLREYYSDDVFNDNNVAAQVPGHLSTYDAWNCITEILSHTDDTAESTAGSLQKFANRLLFPRMESDQHNRVVKSINKAPLLSAFSDPDVAFFGA